MSRRGRYYHHSKALQKTLKKGPLELLIYFFTVATPLFELPQAYTIYVNHNAHNVSFYTWGFFLIDNVVWLIYGVKRKMAPLVVTSILYFIIELSVVIGILKYS